MKGVINFFNIIIIPISLLCGIFINWELFWLMSAIYSSLMLFNAIIYSIANAIIFKNQEEYSDVFWRIFFIVTASISWSFVVYF